MQKRRFEAVGLVVGTVRTLPNPSGSIPPPIVVQQSPQAGTEVPPGTRVNFDLRQERPSKTWSDDRFALLKGGRRFNKAVHKCTKWNSQSANSCVDDEVYCNSLVAETLA